MTAQFQFFQSLPHKKADFVKKKPAEHGVVVVLGCFTPGMQAFYAKKAQTLFLGKNLLNKFLKKKEITT